MLNLKQGLLPVGYYLTISRDEFGPDVTSSLTMQEAKSLVEGVHLIATALKNPIDKSDNSRFTDLKNIFEKSLAVNKDLSKGHLLSFDDLEAKKPKGFGMDATQYETVIGKALNKDLKQWDFLTEDTLQ